jgi:hypothetical protein
MTRADSEFLDLCELDWAQTPTGTILHAVASFDGDDDLVPVGGLGVTVCGRRGRLSIPGMFMRMHAPRCRACCRALGYPDGVGSPKNNENCRALAEARQDRWAGWEPTPEARAIYAAGKAALDAAVEELRAKIGRGRA